MAAALFAGLSLSAKNDFESTRIQKEGREANERYVRYGNAAWITGAVVPVMGLVGFLLWPRERATKRKVALSARPKSLIDVTFNPRKDFGTFAANLSAKAGFGGP